MQWSEGNFFCPFKTNGFTENKSSDLNDEVLEKAPEEVKVRKFVELSDR